MMNDMILSYIFEADQHWPCRATQGQSRKAKATAETFKAKA